MPFRAFCGLLVAAMKWRAREQQMAIAAAAYAWMKKGDQARLRADLTAAAGSEAEEEPLAGGPADQARLRAFKELTAMHKRQYPLDEKTRKFVFGES